MQLNFHLSSVSWDYVICNADETEWSEEKEASVSSFFTDCCKILGVKTSIFFCITPENVFWWSVKRLSLGFGILQISYKFKGFFYFARDYFLVAVPLFSSSMESNYRITFWKN